MTINGDPQENAAYRPGDRDDFDRLYRTCYPRLLRTIYAVTGDAASSAGAAIDAAAPEAPEPFDRGETPTEAGVRVASPFARAA